MKRGIVLVLVIAILLILSILAFLVINLMTQEAQIAEHKIKRIRAFYAVKAGLTHTLEKLRLNQTIDKKVNVGDAKTIGYPISATITVDNLNNSNGPLKNTRRVTAKVEY